MAVTGVVPPVDLAVGHPTVVPVTTGAWPPQQGSGHHVPQHLRCCAHHTTLQHYSAVVTGTQWLYSNKIKLKSNQIKSNLSTVAINPLASKSMGIDPVFGSSSFSIIVGQFIDSNLIQVLHDERISKARP